ncbi:MAG: glycogen synthase GlgA [Pseudomonas sp.]
MGNAAAILPGESFKRIRSKLQEHALAQPSPPGAHHILFVTSELTDLVKVGGLGDVSAALPRALARHHHVRVLIPGYRQVIRSGLPIHVVGKLPGLGAIPPCLIGEITLPDQLIVHVVLCQQLYDRDGNPYGDGAGNDWPDNHIRFARLALAAERIAAGQGVRNWQPDLVHANDWPTGLTPAYMRWSGQRTPCVFTIHNLAYQGLCSPESQVELGLPEEALSAEGMEYYGDLSFLKAGINYATEITTVSQTYAHEITSSSFGCGLEGLLRRKAREGLLSGYVNGIDNSWQPHGDPRLIQRFAPNEWQGKRANTRYVERAFGFSSEPAPLFAVVSRLVHQKGIDLTIAAAEHIVAQGGRIAIIGQGEPALEQQVAKLASRHPGRIGVNLQFCETEARRILAGSDFLLMPSRYEPCGLSQIYAQCYGSLPIARRTGGLADTIEDGVSGFLFRESTVDSYLQAIQRAFNVYRRPLLFNAMRCRAMAAPLYWHQSIKPYDRLYRRLIEGTHAVATRGRRALACAN